MPMEAKKHITARCDGPRCSVVLRFIEEDQSTHPESMWRFLTLILFDGTSFLFCSASCLLDFLRNFTPLMSPRERQAAEKSAHVRSIVSNAADGIIKPIPGKVIDISSAGPEAA